MTTKPYPKFGAPCLPDDFWDRVRVNPDTGCWEWTAGKNKGYGQYVHPEYDTTIAHRIAFMAFGGHYPEDRPHTDHLCRVRKCVNPAHLEAVDITTNNRRAKWFQGKCKRGHVVAGDNLVKTVRSNGRVTYHCLECRRIRSRDSMRRRRAQDS